MVNMVNNSQEKLGPLKFTLDKQTALNITLHPKFSRRVEPSHVICWLYVNHCGGKESFIKSLSSNTKGYSM